MTEDKTQEQFSTGGWSAHATLLVCSLLFMINYMDRQVLSAVLEPMKRSLGLTDSQAGIIQTGFFMSMAVLAYPTALMVDRWSRRKTIGLMALVWSVFTYATGLGKSFIGVLLPRLMVGVGETGFSAGGTAMISAAYPAKSRGKVMGLFYLAVPIGSALGVILGGWLSNKYGNWRAPFYIFAVPGILLGIGAFFLRDYQSHEEFDQSGQKIGFLKQAKELLKIPTLSFSYVGLAMLTFMSFSVLTWLPAFLMRAHGINEKEAGMITGIISLMALIGSPLGGFLSDFWQKRNRRGRMYMATLGSFVAVAALVPAIFLEVKGFGLFLGMIWWVAGIAVMPVLVAASQDVVTPGMRGSAVGLANLCIYLLGGGWAPWAIGLISDSLGGGVNGLKVALMISSMGGVIGGVLFFLASRSYPEDQDRVKEIVIKAEE